MQLNVSDLLKKEKAYKELHLEIHEESFYDGSETIKLLQPIKLDGQLSKIGDMLTLNGTISTLLELNCSRCLEKFNYAVDMTIEEQFTNNDGADRGDDIIFINSDTIDITQVIENNIILTLPIKRLCSDNCKGLCYKCGINLNLATCQCENDNIDPRLAKLKDMFSTD